MYETLINDLRYCANKGESCALCTHYEDGLLCLDNMLRQAADAIQLVYAGDVVLVQHGRWLIKNIRGDKRTVCSECLLETGTCYEYNYCPNCGAVMEDSETS